VVIEPGDRREQILSLLDGDDLEIILAATGEEAFPLAAQDLDGVVSTLSSGIRLPPRCWVRCKCSLSRGKVPTILYGNRGLSDLEVRELGEASRVAPVRLARTRIGFSMRALCSCIAAKLA